MTPAVWYRYRLFLVPAPVPGPVPVVSGPGTGSGTGSGTGTGGGAGAPVYRWSSLPVRYSCTKVVLVFLVWANEYQSVCSIAGEELHAGRASYPRRSLLQNEKKISSHYCFIIT